MTCGIELKGNEARIVVLEGNQEAYNIIGSAPKKIKLDDPNNQDSVKHFLNEIITFVEQFDIQKIGIKERATKGKFAGGSVSFKMEGLLQTSSAEVMLIHSRTIKAKLKNEVLDFTLVNKYQEEALKVAWILRAE